MSTIAVNRRGYVNANAERTSFTEKIRKYFEENGRELAAGFLSMNGNLMAAAQMYRVMK